MKGNYCDRCVSDIKCVTPQYPAKSDNPINKKCRERLGIDTNSALTETIQTCNKHTSPTSRQILHQRNVFTRYEFQFFNVLLSELPVDYTVHLNEVNEKTDTCTLASRYDALIFNRTKLRESYAINIELDEEQHYNKPKQFEEDRIKEACFMEKYGNIIKKLYIFRIRVGEDKPTTCVEKYNKKSTVKIRAQFDENMKRCIEHVRKALLGHKVNPHAYIDFSENKKVSEYPFKDFEDVKLLSQKAKATSDQAKKTNKSGVFFDTPVSGKPKRKYNKKTPGPASSKEKTPLQGPSKPKRKYNKKTPGPASSKEKTPVQGPSKPKRKYNKKTPVQGPSKPVSSKEKTPTQGPPKPVSSKEKTPTQGPSKPVSSKEKTPVQGPSKERTPVQGPSKERTPVPGPSRQSNIPESQTEAEILYQDAIVDGLTNDLGNLNFQYAASTPRTPRTPRTPKKSTAKKPDQSQ